MGESTTRSRNRGHPFDQSSSRSGIGAGVSGDSRLDGGSLEFVLGPGPQVTARESVDADVRLRAPTETVDDYLGGKSLERKRFVLVSGDRSARKTLLDILAAMAG